MMKEYFGNFPMRNDRTCSRRITETQMVIQTEVTLQADYVLSACDGGGGRVGGNTALQKLLFDQLVAYPSSTIVNTSCVDFLSTRWRHCSL